MISEWIFKENPTKRTSAKMSKDEVVVTPKIALKYSLCAVSVLYLRFGAEIQVTINGANGI